MLNNKNNFEERSLEYHASKPAGKISIQITKPTATPQDLSLAYSPGVAGPVRKIAECPEDAYKYTSKGNLVGVISNGTAVLGLGAVGAIASKPVMEGKAALFKRFANIDVFDIEVDADCPETFINTVARISPTFGGINLEDISAPHCFEIERALAERLDIPVFHDDQHGTAVIIAASLLNALHLQGKKLEDITMVCLGAGAAGIASMRLLINLGLRKDNILMLDRNGVIHTGRTGLNPYKFAFAIETNKRTLQDALEGADVFIGVSEANLLTEEMLMSMAKNPIVFALANPNPEINPDIARNLRDDLIIATGRSDHPNQVNNVLCFPFIFRGALDVRAKEINQDMLVAAVNAIKDLAREPVLPQIQELYNHEPNLSFGKNYILPKPMDPRLLDTVSSAVAKAAISSGVARIENTHHS